MCALSVIRDLSKARAMRRRKQKRNAIIFLESPPGFRWFTIGSRLYIEHIWKWKTKQNKTQSVQPWYTQSGACLFILQFVCLHLKGSEPLRDSKATFDMKIRGIYILPHQSTCVHSLNTFGSPCLRTGMLIRTPCLNRSCVRKTLLPWVYFLKFSDLQLVSSLRNSD